LENDIKSLEKSVEKDKLDDIHAKFGKKEKKSNDLIQESDISAD